MINIDEIENDSARIYTILKIADCFQKSEYNERYLPQLIRNMIQFRIINRKLLVYKKNFSNYLDWYHQNLSEFPLNPEDFIYEVVTLTCNHGLATFELLKRFFLNTINLKELNSKTSSNITQTSMLGDLLKSIKKLDFIDKEKLDNLIENEFRNTLAHDSWYLDGNQFKYKDSKGNNQKMSLLELYEKIQKIQCVYKTISNQYSEDFYPEYIREYKDNLGKKLDKDFPLYPDAT